MQAAIKNIIHKTLVKPFYQQHLIILGLVYLIMFGAVNGAHLVNYHLSLIEGTVTSYAAMGLVFAIWIIYFLRTIYFLLQTLRKREYLFLTEINLLDKHKFQLYINKLVIICLLPISSYAFAIFIWAFYYNYFVQGLVVLLFQIALHYISYSLLTKNLKNCEFGKPKYFSLFVFTIHKKYALQFYIKYLFTQQTLQWFLVKLICFIAIKASFFSITPVEELRFSIFFYVMLFLVHTNLIQQFIQWEYTQLWHSRLLPLSIPKKIISYYLFSLIIILPEIILIATVYPYHLNFLNMLAVILLSCSTTFFLFTICIAFNNVTANYSPLIGLYLLLVYGFVLSNNLLLFSLGTILLCSIILYKTIKLLEIPHNNN